MPDFGILNPRNGSNGTCCHFDEPLLFYFLPPMLIVIFVLGSCFNGIALYAFCCHVKTWTSSTVHLFNLAVADFLLMICLPFRIDYYLRQKTWVYGEIPCRLVLFMLAMNRAGSIFFLSLVGLDRYFRVVHPHHRINGMSIKTAICIACAVWFCTVSMTIFIVYKSRAVEKETGFCYCDSFSVCPADFDYHDLHFVLEFFIPLVIILYCSYRIVWRLRQRNLDRHTKIKRAVQCITLVSIVFAVCFLPSVSTRIEVLRLLGSPQGSQCSTYKTVDTAFYVTICFTYMNSMCNPLVYYFSSPSFKIFYRKIMRCTSQSELDSEMEQTDNPIPTRVAATSCQSASTE
ncbi:hydroxycarboxylic acid receptor 2 [Pelodytes ibericus]